MGDVSPTYRDDWLTVYGGDNRDVLRALPDESVHCVITSPPLEPYWGLRDYGAADQLGLEPTPEEYVANMVAVFREVRRVLRNDGTLWLNLGDSYVSNGWWPDAPSSQRTSISRSDKRRDGGGKGVTKVAGLKTKDLVGIPWRVAFALQADGWYLRSDIIWAKPNPMPESVTDRPTKSHEYIFLFSKSATYYFDQEAVRESGQPGSEAPISGVREGSSYALSLFGDPGSQGEGARTGAQVLLHREREGGPAPLPVEREGESQSGAGRPQETRADGYRLNADGGGVDGNQGWPTSTVSLLWPEGAADDGSPDPDIEGWPAQRGQRRSSLSELQQREGQSLTQRNIRSVWTIPTQPYPGAHFAVFPPKLVEPCIKAGTSERGVCADCGAPWRRVVERITPRDPGRGVSKMRDTAAEHLRNDGARRLGQLYQDQLDANPPQTTGWQPSCSHDAATTPATVLDPFAGSGTTGLVAQRLSRRALLIDLNPDYLEQQLERNAALPLGLVG